MKLFKRYPISRSYQFIIDNINEQLLLDLSKESQNNYKSFIKMIRCIDKMVKLHIKYDWDIIELLQELNFNKIKKYQSFKDKIVLDKFSSAFVNAEEKYKQYCHKKTNKMIEYGKINPKIKDSKSLNYFIEKYGEDLGYKKYKEYHSKTNYNTRIDYYINKFDVSSNEAEEMLKNRQSTCSLEKFKLRYGEDLGFIKWSERNAKWLSSLDSKDDNEKLLINMKKGSSFPKNAAKIIGVDVNDFTDEKFLLITKNKTFKDILLTLYSSSWDEYSYKCRALTEITYKKYQFIIDPNKIRSNEFHLDHIYSVFDGFFNNISLDIISHYKNLRIIPADQNIQKSTKSDIKLNELIDLIENFSINY